jgi:3-keto-L-gulonate-6-phosphate decarboxylase
MELNIPQRYRQDIEDGTNLLKNEGCDVNAKLKQHHQISLECPQIFTD